MEIEAETSVAIEEANHTNSIVKIGPSIENNVNAMEVYVLFNPVIVKEPIKVEKVSAKKVLIAVLSVTLDQAKNIIIYYEKEIFINKVV